MKGARLRKIDLHIHTPGSSDFKDPTVTAANIIETAITKKLEAIAITDHNSIAWVNRIQKAASRTKLIVFPAFELNSRGGHLIALFDPSSDLSILETTLIECGVPKQQWGKDGFIGKDIEIALSVISSNGGIAIAAHADTAKGILNAVQQGAARIKVFNHPNLSAIEFVSSEKMEQYSSGKVRGYDRPIAYIQGSDAHKLDQIGRRPIFLRMHRVSIEGIRQAFTDPTIRIRMPKDATASRYAYIESLVVDKGFLQDQDIEFNPSLNCLVGGAGTGKSTIIEFIRFALNQTSEVDSIVEDCHGKLCDLAGIGATIRVGVRTDSGDRYEIQRVFDDTDDPIAIIRLSDNKEMDTTDISSFFQVHAYSQGEVTSICRNPLTQLELIDCHLDLKAYINEIESDSRRLEKQAGLLSKLEVVSKDRPSIESNLFDYLGKIKMYTHELGQLEEAKKNIAVVSHQYWIAEESYWQELFDSISDTRENIEEGIDSVELPVLETVIPEEKTPNKKILEKAQKHLLKLDSTRERIKTIWLKKLDETKLAVQKEYELWKPSFSSHREEYRKAESSKKSARMKRVNDQLLPLRKKTQGLRSKLKEIRLAEKKLEQEKKERERLLERIEDRKKRIRVLREKKAKEIVKKVDNRVSLKYVPDGNRNRYVVLLSRILKGTHAQKSLAIKIASTIKPRHLVKKIRDSDHKSISRASGISDNWAKTLIAKVNAELEWLYRIDVVPIEDLLLISLKVGDGEYKRLDKLSTGQKATVIVLLTMAEGVAPIIFDQPEDALYTPFIYTDVVKTLRQGKDSRQFILATHNPNIAVGADVDLGIVLDGSATQTSISAAGGLDDSTTRGLLLLHLEGGEGALRARQIKFGLK